MTGNAGIVVPSFSDIDGEAVKIAVIGSDT